MRAVILSSIIVSIISFHVYARNSFKTNSQIRRIISDVNHFSKSTGNQISKNFMRGMAGVMVSFLATSNISPVQAADTGRSFTVLNCLKRLLNRFNCSCCWKMLNTVMSKGTGAMHFKSKMSCQYNMLEYLQ